MKVRPSVKPICENPKHKQKQGWFAERTGRIAWAAAQALPANHAAFHREIKHSTIEFGSEVKQWHVFLALTCLVRSGSRSD